ncbi:3 5 -cyclic nucleotide phosphodiesterase domain-containing protein [Cystoisospora suis]|uniref:Phosphodiesterase n=1 Tax=Cystoisospora suis TaxID=483139 RepID=A0A2C6L066_9APIC|nr:3 5 -cyclic nucleotide phosphodiesterase domain-containing protein [Cystoisospora suis]
MVFFPVRAAEGPRSTGVAQSAVTLEHRQVPLLVRREEHLETGGCSDVSPMRRISPDPSSLAGREGKAYPGPDEYDRLEGYFSEPRRTFSMCSSAADESLWSAHIPGGVRVPPSFYCTVGDQLRSIQALCDKQKAQALRSPVEAACSQDASVLSFARSLAATLSSALSSPLVLVCAYDHETDELYCCPASLPLHEHGFSSHAFQQTSHRPNRLSSSSPPVSPRGQVPSSSSPFRHGQNPGHLFPSPPALWPGSSRTPLPSSFPPFPFSVQSSPDRLLLWGRGGGPGPPPFFPVHLGAAAYRAAAAQQLGLAGVPANDIATYFARPFSPRVSFSLFDIRKHDVRAQDRKRSCAQEPPCGLEDNRKIQTNQTQHGETLEKTHQEDEEKKKKASKRRGFFSRRKEKEKSTEKGSSATVGAESSSPGETPHAVTGDEKDAESEGIPGRPQDVGGKEDATRNDAGDKPTAASVGEQDDQPVWLASWQEEEDLIAWQLRQFLRWRMLDDRYAADSVSFSTSRYPRLMSFQRGVLPPSSSAVGVVAAATVEGDSGDSVGGTSSSARVPHPSEKDANSPSHSNASAVVPSGGGRLSLATAMVEKQHQQPPTPGLVPRSFERLGGVGDALHSESARGRKTSGGEGGPGTAELPQSGGRGQDAIRATTGEQDEEEEELRILFSQEREALVLSPTSGCIGRLFQECRDRSAIYLYDSTTDSIVWPESASASAPVEYSTNTIVPQASSQTRGGPSSSSSVPQVSSFSNLPVTPSPSSSSSSSGVGSSSFASSSNAVHLQQPASRCDSISVSTAAAAAPTRPESSGPPEEDVPHIRVTGTSEAKSNVGGTGSYATTAIPVSSTGGESGGLSAAASALPKLSNSHPSSPSFPPPPLCLFVRRLEDRSGSRLWRWIEDTRIDYTLPSQKKRNLAPLSQVTHGPFCRFADRPWASSAYAHGSLTSPPLSVAGGGGEAVTPPPTSPVRNGSADSPGPRKSGDRGGSGGQGGGATESSVINEKGKPKRHGSPHKGFSFSPSGRTAGFLKTLAGSVVPLKEPTTALAAQQHAEGRHLVVGGRTESGAKSSRYNWLRVIQRKETITSLSARSTPRSASWESGINVETPKRSETLPARISPSPSSSISRASQTPLNYPLYPLHDSSQPRVSSHSLPFHSLTSSPSSPGDASGRLASPLVSLFSEYGVTPRASSDAASTSSSRTFCLTGRTRRCISAGDLYEKNAVDEGDSMSSSSEFHYGSAGHDFCRPRRRPTGFSLMAGILQPGCSVDDFFSHGRDSQESLSCNGKGNALREGGERRNYSKFPSSCALLASHVKAANRVRRFYTSTLVLAPRQTSSIRRAVLVSPSGAITRHREEKKDRKRKEVRGQKLGETFSPTRQSYSRWVSTPPAHMATWDHRASSPLRTRRRQSIVLTSGASISRNPSRFSRHSSTPSSPRSLYAPQLRMRSRGDTENAVPTAYSSPCRRWTSYVPSSSTPCFTVPPPSPVSARGHIPVAASASSILSNLPFNRLPRSDSRDSPPSSRHLHACVQTEKGSPLRSQLNHKVHRNVEFHVPPSSLSRTSREHLVSLSHSKAAKSVVRTSIEEVPDRPESGGTSPPLLGGRLRLRRSRQGCLRMRLRQAATGRRARQARWPRAHLLRQKQAQASAPLVAGGGEGLQVKDFGSSFSGTALGGIAAASASSTESRVSRGEAVGNHPSGAGGVGSTTGIQREDSSPSRQHSGPVVEGTSMLSEQWRSVSPRKNQQLLGAGAEVEEVQAGVPMGLVICVQPLSSGVLDGTQQQLMDALGASVEQLLLSVLQVEWLRRDRTKKALQLELHRTVFQESLNPVKKVERLLSLVHTTLSAEQVAFFIVDAQNNSFVCLGGALKARGLTLPYSHPLLGEATRQGGRIVICNDVPPGLNKEYDSLAMINTRAAVLVPLLNAQGFVKALLLLINRCVCNLPMAYYRDSPSPATPSPLHHPMWGGGPSARMHASVGVPTTPDGTPLLVYSPSAPTAASHTRRDTLENFLTGNPRGSFLPPGGGNSPTGGRGGGGLKRASTDLSATLGSIDGGGGEFRCSCPACSPLERQRLSYGDQLLQSLSVGNVLKISHKFTKEDEVYLRCIQCEIQNALGGALTNVCVAGMTLLKPMVTMVSYVVGERDNALLRPSADADQVLAEIQTIVEEDKRQLLRRLRRCQSLAPELDELAGGLRYLKRAGVSSPSSMASDAEGRRKKKGRDEKNLGDERGFPRRRGIEESKSISLIRSSRGGGFFSTEDGDVPLLPHSVSAACNGSLERDAISAFRAQRMPGGMPCSLQRYNTAPCPSRSWKLKSRDGSFPWSVSADTDAEGETDFALQSQQENGVEAGVVVGEGTPHGRDILSERSVLSRYPRQGRGGGGGGEEEEEGGDDGILFRSGTFFGTRDEEDEEEDDRRGFTPSQGAWRPMAAALNGYAEQRAEKRWMTMTGARGSATLRHADSEETGGEGGKGRKGVSEILRKGQTPEESRDMRVGAKTGLPPGASIAAVPVGRTNTALSQKTVGGHRRVTRRRRRASSLPSLVFSAALSKCERHMKAIRKDLILAQYRGWSLDVWRRSSHDMELFFLLALDDLRLLERKEEKKLRQFFATIRDGYHTDNPYHNFYHAIHVFQMCWMFLSACGCRSILSSVEQLGILLAALSHDVDHPGVNNAFLRASLHPLSIMYNDKAVLENHHAAFAVRTLMELNMYGAGERRLPDLAAAPGVGGTAGGGAPLGSRGEVDDRIVTSFAELRKIVIQAIFSTDMELFRQHHDAMKRRAQMKTTEREELGGEDDRSLLVTCLIHCADICNPVMSGGRNIQWASLVTQEFNAQVDLEKRCGLPVSVFMDSRTELQRTQSQIGFLSFVVLDQFRALADLLPAVSELVVQGEKNLDMWQQCLDALKAAEEAQKHCEECILLVIISFKPSLANRSGSLPQKLRVQLVQPFDSHGDLSLWNQGRKTIQEFDGYRPPSLDT